MSVARDAASAGARPRCARWSATLVCKVGTHSAALVRTLSRGRMTHSDHARDDDAAGSADETPATPTPAEEADDAIAPNPPRTTTWGWLTAPKFGSAGSGGAELEPGPERD